MSSNAPRRPVRDLRFFLTVPHACSYLPGKEATTLFLDPQESPVPGVYDSLSL
ncbi:MAG: arginyltransferase, partial [Pseudomonadota bacterium]|nr:arginyltransferase [Pseudomonadota bacterium]